MAELGLDAHEGLTPMLLLGRLVRVSVRARVRVRAPS